MVPEDKVRSFRIFMRTTKLSDLPKPSERTAKLPDLPKPSEIQGAYDSAEGLHGTENMSDETKLRLLAFMRVRLSDAAILYMLDALLGISNDEDGGAQDEPPPFRGRPRPGGEANPPGKALDALPSRLRAPSSDRKTKDRRDFEARFPEAARIGSGPAISTRAG